MAIIFLPDVHAPFPNIIKFSREERLKRIRRFIESTKKIIGDKSYILLLEGIPFGVSYEEYSNNEEIFFKEYLRGVLDCMKKVFKIKFPLKEAKMVIEWNKSSSYPILFKDMLKIWEDKNVFIELSKNFPNNNGWDDPYLLGYQSLLASAFLLTLDDHTEVVSKQFIEFIKEKKSILLEKLDEITRKRDKLLIKAIKNNLNYDFVIVFCGVKHIEVGKEFKETYLLMDNFIENYIALLKKGGKISEDIDSYFIIEKLKN